MIYNLIIQVNITITIYHLHILEEWQAWETKEESTRKQTFKTYVVLSLWTSFALNYDKPISFLNEQRLQ